MTHYLAPRAERSSSDGIEGNKEFVLRNIRRNLEDGGNLSSRQFELIYSCDVALRLGLVGSLLVIVKSASAQGRNEIKFRVLSITYSKRSNILTQRVSSTAMSSRKTLSGSPSLERGYQRLSTS